MRGAKGHTVLSRLLKDGQTPILLSEVAWVRGSVGYLLSMNARTAGFDAWHEGFQKLVESFRFLKE